MRKTIINTLVATTMLTSSIANAVTWNSDYGVITELTPDHIAWLNEHRTTNSGVLAGFVWVKTSNDSYVSMPVSEVRKAISSDEAKEALITKVIKTEVITHINTIIVENRDEIDRLLAEVAALEGDVAAKAAMIGTLTADNMNLQAEIDRLNAMELTFGDITSDILNESNLDNYNPLSFTQSHNDAGYVHMNGDYITQSYVNGWGQTRTYHYIINADGTISSGRLQAEPTGRNVGTTDRSGNLAYLSEYNALTLNDVSTAFFSGNEITINGNTFTLSPNTTFTLDEVANVVEDAYNAGFSNGYDAGYVDGYTDGFADGQSSVTHQ